MRLVLGTLGRKSLRALLRSMEQVRRGQPDTSGAFGLDTVEVSELGSPRLRSPEFDRAAEKLAGSRVASRIRCGDPRISALCGDLLRAANRSTEFPPLTLSASLQQVGVRLASSPSAPPNPSQLVDAIRLIRLKLAELMRMKLEDELRSLAAAHLRGRNLEVVLSLWGWSGDLPRTLQSVGDSFGITRERVRQIALKSEKINTPRRAFLPRVERVLRIIARHVPVVADEIEIALQTRGLTHSRFRVESIVECAKQVGQPVMFVLDKSGGARVITEARDTGLVRLIASRGRRAVAKYGMINAAESKAQLADTLPSGVDIKIVSDVTRAMTSCEDLGKGWFWLRDVPRNHLLTIARKVLAVSPRIHVNEMRAADRN